MHGQQNIKSIT